MSGRAQHESAVVPELSRSCKPARQREGAAARLDVSVHTPLGRSGDASMDIEWKDLEAIKRLKYRYMRCIDTKLWDEIGDLFTDDCEAAYSGGKYAYSGRDAIVEFLSGAMSADGFHSSHQVSQPEIDLVDAATVTFERIVVDLGTGEPDHPVLKRSDTAVLVADASAVGVVRAAHLVAMWFGPPPTLIWTRAAPRGAADVIAAAKEWTGIEPSAVIPERPSIRAASLAAKRPDGRLRKPLAPIGTAL